MLTAFTLPYFAQCRCFDCLCAVPAIEIILIVAFSFKTSVDTAEMNFLLLFSFVFCFSFLFFL